MSTTKRQPKTVVRPRRLIADGFRYTGHSKALVTAATHISVISYTVSAEILQKEGLELERKKYYNKGRKEGLKDLKLKRKESRCAPTTIAQVKN